MSGLSGRVRTCAARLAAVLAAFFIFSTANAQSVVVPNTLEFVEGASNNCIPLTGCQNILRYQQVYASGDFGNLTGTGQVFINRIVFRPDNGGAYPPGTYSDIEIRLSTTPALFGPNGQTPIGPDNLFTTFALNIGPDEAVVYRGPLTLESNTPGSGAPGPSDFNIVIDLQTPFLYDPALGNLLFEWRNYGGENLFLPQADSVNDFGDSTSRMFDAFGNGGPEAVTGVAGTSGLVTQFVFIEPQEVVVDDVPTPTGEDVPVIQVNNFFEQTATEVVIPGTTSAAFCVSRDRRWKTDIYGHTTFKYRSLKLSELAGSGTCTGEIVEGEQETWEDVLAQIELQVQPYYRSYLSEFTPPGAVEPVEDYWVVIAVVRSSAEYRGVVSVINFPESLLDFSGQPLGEQPGCDRDVAFRGLDLAGPVPAFGEFPSVDGRNMSVTTGQCNRGRSMTRRTTHAYPFRLAKDYAFEQEEIEIKNIDRQFSGLLRTISEASTCADPSLIANLRSNARAAKRELYAGNLDLAEELLEEVARSADNADQFGSGFDNCPIEANYPGEVFRRGVTGAFTVHDRWQHPDDFVLYLLPSDFDVPGFASESFIP